MMPRERKSRPTEGLALSIDREPQSKIGSLPSDIVVVSADSHLTVAEDIWWDRFPRQIKERAPRVIYDAENEVYQIYVDGAAMYPPSALKNMRSMEGRPGASNMAARLRDMDIEGVDKEIVFPNGPCLLFNHPDFEVREWAFRIYNQYLAEFGAQAPGRFYGVGIANWWDPAKARASIDEIRRLGLKTFMIPMNPGKTPAGEAIDYVSAQMDPLWTAIEESGLPLCFHTGEGLRNGGPGAVGIAGMQAMGPFRKNLGELIFGGVFDRHPQLRIAFAEAGLNWVPGALQDAELFCDSMPGLLDPMPKRRPSEYWHEHCYALFMRDPVGLKLLDEVGADHALWSSDYPHNESTLGYNWSVLQEVVDATTAENARKILGGTAVKLFDLQ